jgi:hypothetical protein
MTEQDTIDITNHLFGAHRMKHLTAILAAGLVSTCTPAPAWNLPVTHFTTPNGGAYGRGAIYEAVGHKPPTIIYSFCADQTDCKDGAAPLPTVLTMDDGSLVGATTQGGASAAEGGPNGTVYRLAPNGTMRVMNYCPYFMQCLRYGPIVSIIPVDADAVDVISQVAAEEPNMTRGARYRFYWRIDYLRRQQNWWSAKP